MIRHTFKIMILSALLVLAGCRFHQAKIGFLMDDFSSERWYKDKDLFIEKAKNLKCDVLLDSSMGSAVKQLDQARSMLEKGIEVLVIVPTNNEKAAEIVNLAHTYDVPVISYDRLIKNCDLDYYISFESSNVGELMADYLSKQCPIGNYAIISGPPTDNNSFFIKLGEQVALQPLIVKGDIKLVFDGMVNEWSADEGYRLMKECLQQNKKVDAVLAANDQLADGVIKALKEKNLEGKVLVSGMDAETDAITNIIKGYQTMTVYKPIEAIAFAAANAANRIANNQSIPEANQYINNGKKMVPSILLTTAMIVNKDNINMTVMADGYLKQQNLIK
jgi:D-xylose transport system substrate-binding protein